MRMRDYCIKIQYRDNTSEEYCCSSYQVKDGCLIMSNRFGVNSGIRNIPLDRIKEYIVC